MNGLIEFLLARIAEDEANARKRLHHAQQNDLIVRDPKYLGMFMPGWHEWREVEAFAARVLAECEAKRRLVAEHDEEWHRPHRNLSPMNSYLAKGRLNGLWVALQILALPHAGHPDYREEWRP